MITIKDLYKTYDHKDHILKGVSLTAQTGETVAVIGPSGCGKSTLLRLIIGLEKADSGSILIDDNDITTLSQKELDKLRMKFGFVFQSSALFDSLSIGENIAFYLREHTKLSEQQIRNTVQEKLELVGLPGLEKQMPAELSGGMQKRISLARAIVHNPDIILYDEPTTGLDPILSTSIEDLINKLNRELQVTAILVTHQISTINRCAQKIAMLHEGQIINAGNVSEAQQSSHEVVRNFLRVKCD
jgi:phospholipid/cholesterol/gamma-HCH transport system ATP-binding protein